MSVPHPLSDSAAQPVRRYPDDEVTLGDIWRTLVDGKWIIAASTALTVVLATAAAFLMTPIYKGEVLLAAQTSDGNALYGLSGQLGGLASLAGLSLDSVGDQRTVAIAMLRSRQLAERFIQEYNLLPVLFADIWDSENKRWLVEDPEDEPNMRRGVRRFEEIRSVNEDIDTGLVTLTIEWRDRETAAKWASDYVDLLNAEMRQRAIAEAEQSIAYLQAEADKTNVLELKQAIYSLIEEQIRSVMLASVREDFAFRVIDPAVVPDVNERVRPKRRLMVALAFILGGLLGVLAVFFRSAVRMSK